MSLTGAADGPPLPGRDLGVRRDGGQPRGDRHPGRAPAPRCDRRGAGGRGQPAVVSAVGPGQPQLGVGGGGRGALPHGQRAPVSVYPYEPLPTADRDLIVAAPNDRIFRKLCDVLGIPDVPEDPRFRRNSDRTANRAELQPILVERLATRSAEEWFTLLVDAGVPCGPINTIDGGFAMAEKFGLEPVIEAGEGERALPMARHPITFSATPGHLPAAAARAGRARRRAAEVAGRGISVSGMEFETALGASTPDKITLLGMDLAQDVMGEVGFGELAFWLATQQRPTRGADQGVRGGVGRARRPRVHPHRDRRPHHLVVRARLRPRRARRRAARRRLALPWRHRGHRPVPARRAPGARTPERRCRLGCARPRDRARTRAAGRFVPGLGHPSTRTATRARQG